MGRGPPSGAALGKVLRNVLSRTLTEHAQAILPAQVEARSRGVRSFLEGLEGEIAPVASQVWEGVLTDPDIPESFKQLLRRAATPQQQVDAIFGIVFAAFAVVPIAAQVGTIEFERSVLQHYRAKLHPYPLPPDQAAAAVQRGLLSPGEGAEEALRSGIDGRRFGVMEGLARQVPGLAGMIALWRRGEITTDRLREAVRESQVGLKWMPEVERMSIIPPSPIEPLEALLEGQITEAEAREWYRRFGGLEEWFTIGFNTRGQAPTPVQALDMLNRGIISERGRGPASTSWEQSFLEGPWRNKWLDPFLALREYLPPPRTIVTLLRHGAITSAEAIDLFRKNGLSSDLAKAYVDSASREKTGPQRDLAKSEVASLYEARFITRADAEGMLEALGFDPHESDLLLALADSRRDRRYQEALIATVHARYVGWKIDAAAAQRALDSIHVPPEQKAELLQVWEAERAVRAPELTLAQAQGAFRRGRWDEARLRQWLAQRGYDPEEVDVLVLESTPAPRAR